MHPVKILLVDDDTDLVDWLGYAFRRDGYKVYTATNGEAASRLFETQAPDVVVLDLVMPRRDGMEVLRDIRKQSNAPVILLTAVGDEDHVIKALKSGADDYVVKPFRPRELRARVEAVLRRAQAAGQARPVPQEPLRCGNIALDPGLKEVS
ncbi:MAG: response regulator transcription factor, partial [Rudaea sp.]